MSNPIRLFVGNLSYRIVETDLQNHFGQAGVVSSVEIMFDKFTGKSRGFAFVQFSSAEEAERAVELLNGQDFDGRALTVNVAKPREERASSSGGYRQDR